MVQKPMCSSEIQSRTGTSRRSCKYIAKIWKVKSVIQSMPAEIVKIQKNPMVQAPMCSSEIQSRTSTSPPKLQIQYQKSEKTIMAARAKATSRPTSYLSTCKLIIDSSF